MRRHCQGIGVYGNTLATEGPSILTADTATIPTPSGAAAPGKAGALAPALFDRRTRQWRRRQELIGFFTEALGGAAMAGPVLSTKIEVAAELAVVAEVTRAAFMRGEAVADDVVRTSNQASRAERALGIEARAAKVSPPSLKDYMAERNKGSAAG